MPADLYRDALVGIRARLVDLDRRIRERETELTDAFWSNLEPYLRERLGELRAALELVGAESLDKLARAEVLLSAYAEELDAWIARAPALEEEWLAVPGDVGDPPPVPGSGPRLSSVDGREFLRTFGAIVRETASPGVELVEDGWWSCIARFRHRDAPFVLRASALPTDRGRIGEVSMQMVTSVARAAPPLLVKHESLFAAVGKAMGWRKEVEVGDASFDGLFFIQGAKSDASRFLVPKVRSFLMTLARFDVPTLEIDPAKRTASLSWRFEPVASAIEAAVRTLTVIREMPSTICFRR
ncbi:MAG: hypothetical protein KF764_09190 [Labilithrix sp.]|nr:hypothetical protein [Labilithrix sp.]MBX3224741.1 hypothetical protein [Labilithrix sp.]